MRVKNLGLCIDTCIDTTHTRAMTTTQTYAIDRVGFRKAGEDRIVIVDGVEIGTLFRAWSRLGGEGWTHDPKGATQRTLKAAAKTLISAALRDGRITNVR